MSRIFLFRHHGQARKHPAAWPIAVCLSLFVVWAAGAGAEPAEGGPKDILARFHTALSDGDRQTVKELTSPDLLIYESGGAERSFAEYASHHLGADMKFAAAMTDTILNQDIQIVGDTAWAVTERRSEGMWQDRRLALHMTETAILKRRNDAWRIVHFHWSSRPISDGQ